MEGPGQPVGGRRPRFALMGAAGFIAPRHMKAMREVGGDLVAALDPSDSVGIIDSYFPESDFFTEVERFDRHLDKARREGRGVSHVAICTPNYLHDAHVRLALRNQADAICEKPLVLNPWNVDALAQLERETGRRIWTILQLRLHPAIVALRERHSASAGGSAEIEVTYITSRGRWYHRSWKNSLEKSGGIATNIGVHFFDMLSWVFGPMRSCAVNVRREDCAAGVIELERARVRWFLSVNSRHLPIAPAAAGQRTHRSITIGGEEVEFSDGFGDLHTASYREILAGRGFPVSEVRPSIEMVHAIRTCDLTPPRGDSHPLCQEDR